MVAGSGRWRPLARTTGGTLFGNPLSAAAANAALTEVLVPAAYQHASALGSDLDVTCYVNAYGELLAELR
jgi:glutamate-1-semialdehyde aminotransferase